MLRAGHLAGRIALLMFVATLVVPAQAQERSRRARERRREPGKQLKAPRVDEIAPPLNLRKFDDKNKKVALADFKGEKPVVLIFGSYT